LIKNIIKIKIVKENKIIKHVKENPIHSTATGILAATTVGLTVLSAILNYKLNTKKPLDKKELEKFLMAIPAGPDILTLLHLNLTDSSTEGVIKLKAYKGQNKETEGTGETANQTYIEVTAGSTNNGMCAAGRILAGLETKVVNLTNLATYLAFKASGATKLTAKTEALSDNELFKPVTEDEPLATHIRDNLNENGKLLAELIEDFIFGQLKTVTE